MPVPHAATRRTLTRAAVWSAPAVAAAAATPAYAATGAPRLVFQPGATAPVTTAWDPGEYYWDLAFSGASVSATAGSLTAGQLTLTVTLRTTDAASSDVLWVYPRPAGWSVDAPDNGASFNPTYTCLGAVAEGVAVPLAGTWFGAGDLLYSGAFDLTFQAPGFTPVTASFSFGGTPAARRALVASKAAALRTGDLRGSRVRLPH